MSNIFDGIDVSDIKEQDNEDTKDNIFNGIDVSDIANNKQDESSTDYITVGKVFPGTEFILDVYKTKEYIKNKLHLPDISNKIINLFTDNEDEEPTVEKPVYNTPQEQIDAVHNKYVDNLKTAMSSNPYASFGYHHAEALAEKDPEKYGDLSFSSIKLPYDLIIENHEKEQLALDEINSGLREPTFGEAVKEGAKSSIAGLYLESGDYFPTIPGYTEEVYKQLPAWKRAAFNLSTVTADLPFYAASALATTPVEMIGGPTLHGAATFAIPGMLRRHYTTKIETGEVNNWNDYWNYYLKPELKDGAKEGIIGYVTFGVDKYTGQITSKYAEKIAQKYAEKTLTRNLITKLGGESVRLTADDIAMTLTGDLLYQQAPTYQQFVDNAIMLSFIHEQNKFVNKSITGINKEILIQKVKKSIDVFAKGDFLSLNKMNERFLKDPKALDDFMSMDPDIPDIFKVVSERKVIELKINADEVKARKAEVSKANKQLKESFNKFIEELNIKNIDINELKSNTKSINRSLKKVMDVDLDTTIKTAEDYYYGIGLLEPDAATTDMGRRIVNNVTKMEEYRSLEGDIKTLRTKIINLMEKEDLLLSKTTDTNNVELNNIKTQKRNLIVQLNGKYKNLMPVIKEIKILEGMKDRLVGLNSFGKLKEYRYSLGDPLKLGADEILTETASSKENVIKQLQDKGIDTSKLYMLYEASPESKYVKDVLNDTILKSYMDRNTFNDVFKYKEESSQDPNIEIRSGITEYRNASAQEKTVVDKYNDWLDEMKSAFKKVPNTSEYADFRFKMYMIDRMGKVKAEEVISNLDSIWDRLNENQRELFELKILMEDELETIDRNRTEAAKINDQQDIFNERPKVQTHWTEWFSGKSYEDIIAFKDWIDSEIEKSNITDKKGSATNKIKDALKADKEYMDTIRSAVIESYRVLGIDIAGKFTRDNYFTHRTLSHAKDSYTARGLKSGTNRPYFKERSRFGTTSPYETNYRISRYEVAHALLMDIEMNKLKLYLKENFSDPRIAVLKEEYAKINHTNIYQRIDKLKNDIIELENKTKNKVDNKLINEKTDNGILTPAEIELITDKKAELLKLLKDTSINGEWKQFINKEKESIIGLGDVIKTTYSSYDKAIIDKINEYIKDISKEEKELLVEKILAEDEIVLPNSIAEAINSIGNIYVKSNPWTKALGLWKEYQLFNPLTVFKYNLRNFEGDFEAVLAGNPSSLKKISQAYSELLDAKKGILSENLKTFKERGADISTLQAQEFHDIEHKNIAGYFKNLEEGKKSSWYKKYFQTVEGASNFRELVLRYATYLSYLEQMEQHPFGAPKNFGASKPDEIMGITNKYDRAYMLSNDLIGAYDRISAFGTWARRNLIPFYSWMEVNAKRSTMLLRNALMQEKDMERLGIKVLSKNKTERLKHLSSVMAIKVGQYFLAGMGIQTLIQAFNNGVFHNEEKDLPENVRNSFHFVFGRDENNSVSYFGNIGAFNDLLQWFGLQSLPNKIISYLDSGVSLEEALNNWYDEDFTLNKVAKTALNKLIQGTTPFIKTPVELITGKQLYPDIWNPKTIHDRLVYIFKSLRIDDEYKHVANILGAHYPVKDYDILEEISNLFIYKADTYQSGYYDTLDLVKKYKKEMGKSYEFAMSSTPKGEALYNYRLSIIYGDEDAKEYWEEQYVEAGGKMKNIKQSMKSLHPLNGLTKAEKADFKSRLTDDEWNKFEQSITYYNALRLGDMIEIQNAEPTGIHKFTKAVIELSEEDLSEDAQESIEEFKQTIEDKKESANDSLNMELSDEDKEKLMDIALSVSPLGIEKVGAKVAGKIASKIKPKISSKYAPSVEEKLISSAKSSLKADAELIIQREKALKDLPKEVRESLQKIEPITKNKVQVKLSDKEKVAQLKQAFKDIDDFLDEPISKSQQVGKIKLNKEEDIKNIIEILESEVKGFGKDMKISKEIEEVVVDNLTIAEKKEYAKKLIKYIENQMSK